MLEGGKHSRESKQNGEEVSILKDLQWAHTIIPASYLFCIPIWYFTLWKGRKKPKFLTAGYLLPCGLGDIGVVTQQHNAPQSGYSLCKSTASKTLQVVNI